MYKMFCMVIGYVEDPTKLSNGGWAHAWDNTLERCASLHFPVAGPSCHFTRYNHSNQHETDTTATKGDDFDSVENPQELDNKLFTSVFSQW